MNFRVLRLLKIEEIIFNFILSNIDLFIPPHPFT